MEQEQANDTDTNHIAPGNLTQYASLFEALAAPDEEGIVQQYSNDYAGCGWPRAIFNQLLETHEGDQIHVLADDANTDQLWVKGELNDTEQAVFYNNPFQWGLLKKLSHENAFTMYRDNAQGLMDRAMRWFKKTKLTEASSYSMEKSDQISDEKISDEASSEDVFLDGVLDEQIIYAYYIGTRNKAYEIRVLDGELQSELRKLIISIKLATQPIVNEMLSEMLYRVMVRGALVDYSSSKKVSHDKPKPPTTTKATPYEKHTPLKTSQLNYYRMLFTCKNDANQASLDLLTTAGDLPDILEEYGIHPDFAYFDFAYIKIAAFWLCFCFCFIWY